MVTGIKRSLFSKPAWAAASTTNSKSEQESIFGRNVNYDDIMRAEKAERERKAARAKARAQKVKSEVHESKRRRTSTPPGDERSWDSDREPKEKRDREGRVTRSTPKKDKSLGQGLDSSPETHQSPPRRRGGKVTVVNLDEDDEDDELIMLTPPKPKKATPMKQRHDLDEDNSDEEDEYLRELKQKAREKARLQRQGGHIDKRPSPPVSRDASASIGERTIRTASWITDHAQPASSTFSRPLRKTELTSPDGDDPLVKIFIMSEIPGAKPLIVKRKASQSLKQVREFWCRKFDLDEGVARQVFFTWKGTRLFDSTTMKGIVHGLKREAYQRQRSVSGFGDSKDDGGADGFDEKNVEDPSGGNIELEAMTQDIYNRKLREKLHAERQQIHLILDSNSLAREDPCNEEPETTVSPAAAAEAAEKGRDAIIIRLVSKDLEPMPLRVRPHTTVGKIMRGFAATRKVEEGKTPWLIYDGQRLEMEMTVEEVGFEEDEQVEVSVR